MKISKNKLKTIINEEIQKIQIEEGFMDIFRGPPIEKKPKNWRPEPQPEMLQTDMFPGQGYGDSMSDAQISKAAQDVILSAEIPLPKKSKMLHDLAKKVKKDSSLASRIHQAAMYVGDSEPRELAQAVKIFERKVR